LDVQGYGPGGEPERPRRHRPHLLEPGARRSYRRERLEIGGGDRALEESDDQDHDDDDDDQSDDADSRAQCQHRQRRREIHAIRPFRLALCIEVARPPRRRATANLPATTMDETGLLRAAGAPHRWQVGGGAPRRPRRPRLPLFWSHGARREPPASVSHRGDRLRALNRRLPALPCRPITRRERRCARGACPVRGHDDARGARTRVVGQRSRDLSHGVVIWGRPQRRSSLRSPPRPHACQSRATRRRRRQRRGVDHATCAGTAKLNPRTSRQRRRSHLARSGHGRTAALPRDRHGAQASPATSSSHSRTRSRGRLPTARSRAANGLPNTSNRQSGSSYSLASGTTRPSCSHTTTKRRCHCGARPGRPRPSSRRGHPTRSPRRAGKRSR
jgi:hypothetical protein